MFRYKLLCNYCGCASHSLMTKANNQDTILLQCVDCGHTLATLSRYVLHEPKEEEEEGKVPVPKAKDTDDEDAEPSD